MRFKEYIFMALKDLWRRKGRTILTSLGITIGTLLIVTMVGLGSGFNTFINDFVNSSTDSRTIDVMNIEYLSDEEFAEADPVTYRDDYYKKIDKNTLDEIKDTKRAESISAYIDYYPTKILIDSKEFNGFYNFYGFSLDNDIFSQSLIDTVREKEDDDSIEAIKEGKDIENDSEILLSEDLIKELKLKSKDVLNKEITIVLDKINQIQIQEPITKTFKVVGIMDRRVVSGSIMVGTDKDVAYLKGASILQNDYLNNKGYDYLQIVANKIEDVEKLSDKLKEMNYYSQSSLDLATSIDESLGSISIGLAILGIVVLVVAAIGIINTMSMAVLERTKSIGVMKSVGANSKTIKTMFLVQSSFIGLFGGLIGILLGSGINSIIQFFINNYIESQGLTMSISVGMPWYLVLATLLFAMIISLVAGIYPASKAAKLDPIEALRR